MSIAVKISAKSARMEFNGCDPEYIKQVCHSSCCQSSISKTGILIVIHPAEQQRVESRGGIIENGLLQPPEGEKRCPFKSNDSLCELHNTPDKPFGCVVSPFTLNKNKTLIIRHRYRMLKCFKGGRRLPAYEAFRNSLDRLFGLAESKRICDHLNGGGGDIYVSMPTDVYRMILDNDTAKIYP